MQCRFAVIYEELDCDKGSQITTYILQFLVKYGLLHMIVCTAVVLFLD